MLYTLKNDKITVSISDMGGELMSIKSSDGTEYLWQGNPEYWAGRAYNLFPIVGRLTEGKYTYKGKTFEMNLHGFVRKTELKVKNQSETEITFFTKADEKSLSMYPFDFEFQLKYKLTGNTLITTYNVVNNSNVEMPFAVGGHPGFNVPLTQNETFEDYYLEFDCVSSVKEIVLSPTCYITDAVKDFNLKDGKILNLKHSLFDNDAIVLKDMCRKVTLKSQKGSKSITVDYPQMQYLGIWHKPKSDAPYVCIEPWTSLPAYDGVIDDLETKRDMIKLKSKESYINTVTITIK